MTGSQTTKLPDDLYVKTKRAGDHYNSRNMAKKNARTTKTPHYQSNDYDDGYDASIRSKKELSES